MTQTNEQRDKTLEGIAKCVLGIPTLRERGSDQLDFHEVSVWGLRDALEQAYEAGAKAAPANAVCRALDGYASNAYEDLPADLAAIVEQAREAIKTKLPAGTCPYCGEEDDDKLTWDDAGTHVICETCGTSYVVLPLT